MSRTTKSVDANRRDADGSIETAIGPEPTNGAQRIIEASMPYRATIAIKGVADFLFHRWNCEAVEAKAVAAKGSKAKKSDDLESYVYRDDDGNLAIPGEYLRQSIINAARFSQDPRSPRKSAVDLVKAGLVCTSKLSPIGPRRSAKWDYEDRRRVVVQRNAITRVRPAMLAGWEISVDFAVVLPEYISHSFLTELVSRAGALIGVGDFRPTYGRFATKAIECVAL